jgi:hypothetical protein
MKPSTHNFLLADNVANTPKDLLDMRHALLTFDRHIAECASQLYIARHQQPGYELDAFAAMFMNIVAAAADAHSELDNVAERLAARSEPMAQAAE